MGAGLRTQIEARRLQAALDQVPGGSPELARSAALLEQEGQRIVEAGAEIAATRLTGRLLDVLA